MRADWISALQESWDATAGGKEPADREDTAGRIFGACRSELTRLVEAEVATPCDNQMVDHLDLELAPGFDHRAGECMIFATGVGAARWVVMGEDYCRRPRYNRWRKHFPWCDANPGNTTGGYLLEPSGCESGVQQQNAHNLTVLVSEIAQVSERPLCARDWQRIRRSRLVPSSDLGAREEPQPGRGRKPEVR